VHHANGANSPPRWYIRRVRALIAALFSVLLVGGAAAQKTVSFPTEDGGVIYADVYGEGDRDIVLAHGGQFNKESWEKQARTLMSAGFLMPALDFRGYGKSRGPGQSNPLSAPLYFDILAAAHYPKKTGARSVSVIGASMGAGAAGDTSVASRQGEIYRLVFLGEAPYGAVEKLKAPSLFIVARDDSSGDGPRLPRILAQCEKAPDPQKADYS